MFMPRFTFFLPGRANPIGHNGAAGLYGLAGLVLPVSRQAKFWLRDNGARMVVVAVELLLVVALGYVLAQFFWAILGADDKQGGTVVAPAITYKAGERASNNFSALLKHDLFHRSLTANHESAASDRGAESFAAETALDLTLNGVRAVADPEKGTAIVRLPDKSQRSFSVGDEIVAGVRLLRVLPDRIELSHQGAREQLRFPHAEGAARRQEAVFPSQQPAVEKLPGTAAQLFQHVEAKPRRIDGQLQGFLLYPRSDGAVFQAIGLLPGDVLMAVNDRPMTSYEQMAEFADQFAGVLKLSLKLERDGQLKTLTVAGEVAQ